MTICLDFFTFIYLLQMVYLFIDYSKKLICTQECIIYSDCSPSEIVLSKSRKQPNTSETPRSLASPTVEHKSLNIVRAGEL